MAGAGAAAAITWLAVAQTIARAAMSKLNLIFVSAFEAVLLDEFIEERWHFIRARSAS